MRMLLCSLVTAGCAFAWGVRGRHEMNRAVVEALADTELQFLLAQKDWIVYLGPIPDSYRGTSEPFLKIFEDPNHGRFLEQSRDLMSQPPRSRYEFVIDLYVVDHYLKAGRLTETVYQIDKAGGWVDKQNQQARELVLQQLAGGAEVMRNLIYTAWVKSGAPMGARTSPNDPRNTANPLSPGNPHYNPKTGSAPAVKP